MDCAVSVNLRKVLDCAICEEWFCNLGANNKLGLQVMEINEVVENIVKILTKSFPILCCFSSRKDLVTVTNL